MGFPIRQWLRRKLGLANGGAFVVIRDQDDVLVVRHSYRPRLDVPGGGIRRGEAPRDAALRELHEETGVCAVAEDLRYLGRVRRGFCRRPDRDHVFEYRTDMLPAVHVDRRELIWAGGLASARSGWSELEITLRWYLRRHAPDLVAKVVRD